MISRLLLLLRISFSILLLASACDLVGAAQDRGGEKHLLYVAVPGIRDYLEYGGHGILVFDIENGHKFVRRIPTGGLDEKGHALNVKGICANHKHSGYTSRPRAH
jgi:hypothetical protein